MRFSNSRLALAAAMLILCGAGAHAQTHEAKAAKTPTQPQTSAQPRTSTVQLGDKIIVIPDPEGFEEAASQFANVKQRMTATEAPANDMLLTHMLVSDCDLLRRGAIPTYSQYTKVSVLRRARELSMTRPMMVSVVDAFRRNASTLLDPNTATMQDFEKRLEQELSRIDSNTTQLDFSKPELLGEFDTRPDVASFLMLMSFKVNSGSVEQIVHMLTTTSFVRVKERVIFVYAYRKYKGTGDIATLKQFTTEWTNSILAANRGQ
jgi:hypothetical protein